jgi:DNA-3-methyladenine glycosylase
MEAVRLAGGVGSEARGARQRTRRAGTVADAPGRRRGSGRSGTTRWGSVLPRAFYERRAPAVALDLLGCVLVSRIGGRLAAGRIVETEAYLGPEDAASHAAFRPSSRHLFHGAGGIAYVFQAYGLHACLNAIAGPRGTPGCVLIRALEPLAGVPLMARRRRRPDRARGDPRPRSLAALTSGPARLTQALGITLRDSGQDLRRGPLTIHASPEPPRPEAAVGVRIGITRARELPLRYWIPGSPFVSAGGGRSSAGSAIRRRPGALSLSGPARPAPTEGWPIRSGTRGSGRSTARRRPR